jgi:lipopolysaccharide transport system ATP-binding protein
MSSDVALKINGVSKRYEIYSAPHHRLLQTFFHGRRQFFKEFWALKNVSFEVKRGECVGIIGRNGSGKSTLLQVITGTLEPTLGSAEVSGRVSALLELGSGFNPEFTGRENVYMNGAILGISRAEMDKRFDDIAAFADIGDFIEQPVKTYSSGMYVRLAFAVAINVDPEILIIDEALSVGDARFQARCMTRINKFKESGVSILFVSHDTETVKRICNRAIVLDSGNIVNSGLSLHMVNWYLAFLTNNFDLDRTKQLENNQGGFSQLPRFTDSVSLNGTRVIPPDGVLSLTKAGDNIDNSQYPEFTYFRHGDGKGRVISIGLYDEKGQFVKHVSLGRTIYCRIEVEFYAEILYHIVGMHIRDSRGTDIIAVNTFQEHVEVPSMRCGERLTYWFSLPIELRPGHYSISLTLAYDQMKMEWMDWIDNALVFHVIDPEPKRMIFGVYYPTHLKVEIERK